MQSHLSAIGFSKPPPRKRNKTACPTPAASAVSKNFQRTAVTDTRKTNARRMPSRDKLSLLSGLLLAVYLVSLFHARLHLLTHAHLVSEVLSPSQSALCLDGADDDRDHPPHPASDHEALVICISAPDSTQAQSRNAANFVALSITASDLLRDASLLSRRQPDAPGPSPPELVCTWQFSFRAALPARAPSFSS